MTSQTAEHVTSLRSTDIGIQAVCSCGWTGVDRCRMSDDYAWTNASDEANRHAPKKPTRGYLGSTPDGGIDDGP